MPYKPRPITALNRIINNLSEKKMINPDLVLSLETWDERRKRGVFNENAKTKVEGAARVRTILGNLPNANQVALSWMIDKKAIDPESEEGLRCRLSDEMAWCLRMGGVDVSGTSWRTVREDVPTLVKEALYGLNPNLTSEVETERSQRESVNRPSQLEGGNIIG